MEAYMGLLLCVCAENTFNDPSSGLVERNIHARTRNVLG
jgi:hypothetical protein